MSFYLNSQLPLRLIMLWHLYARKCPFCVHTLTFVNKLLIRSVGKAKLWSTSFHFDL